MTFRKAKKKFGLILPLYIRTRPKLKKEYWRRYKTISGVIG